MRVIFQDDNYTLLLILAGVDTMESRHDQLTKHFFHTQCVAKVIVFALFAAGQTRHVGDRTTAPS